MNLYRRYGWELTLAALLVLEILLFGLSNSRMLDINVLLFSTSDFICIGIVALPLTMVIVSGGIDISFGSTIGLCAIFLGIVFQAGVPMSVAIPLTVLVGALCGLINAGLILYTGVNPWSSRSAPCICSVAVPCCYPASPVRQAMKGLAVSRPLLLISPTKPSSGCQSPW